MAVFSGEGAPEWTELDVAIDVCDVVPTLVTFLGYDPFASPNASFPLQLKATRIAAGLTRRQLAARLKVHPGTGASGSGMRRGQLSPPRSGCERCSGSRSHDPRDCLVLLTDSRRVSLCLAYAAYVRGA